MTAGAPPPSELRTRLLVAPTLLVLIAGVYALDVTWLAERGQRGLLTAVLLGALTVGGCFEYARMLHRSGRAVSRTALLAAAVAVSVAPFVLAVPPFELLGFATLALVFVVAARSLSVTRMEQGLERQAATLLGFVWIAWSGHLAQHLALEHLPAVLFVVLVCKGGDIGAYLSGTAFGRHKLIPHISGGKTVEGTAGGLLVAVLLAVALRGPLLAERLPLGLTAAIGIGIMLNATTQIGDLIESLLKRRCGVKDSSTLLPAHGGVLDLTDSLLFSFPAFHLALIVLTP